MAWSWTRVMDTYVAAVGVGYCLAEAFDMLWVLTDHMRLYRSLNGTSWAEISHPSWSAFGNEDANKWLFNHQGMLYAHVGQGLYEQYKYGSWNTLCSASDPGDLWWRANTDDNVVIIAGIDSAGGAIWRWDGSSLVKEFTTDGLSTPRALRCITPFYDTFTRQWYCHVRYGNSLVDLWDTVFIRNENTGEWTLFHTCTRGDGDSIYWGGLVHFCTTPYGMLFGGELYDHIGNWTDTLLPGDAGACTYKFGEVIMSRNDQTVPPPPSDCGKVYVYKGGTDWTYKGEIEPNGVNNVYARYVCDFQDFKGRLYACGRRHYLDFPQRVYRTIWRNDPITTVYYGPGGWEKPTSRTLVCDHEFGDTIYIGAYKSTGVPVALKLNEDMETWEKIFDPTGGSLVGVQTADRRDVAYAFGFFGTDNQVQITDDAGATFSDADDNWAEDKVPTLEYSPTSGSDLVITLYAGQDLKRTLTATKPWIQIADIPVYPRSQLRVEDDVFVGSDTPTAYPVRMYDLTAGSWTIKSAGLPTTVAINDLELGF